MIRENKNDYNDKNVSSGFVSLKLKEVTTKTVINKLYKEIQFSFQRRHC